MFKIKYANTILGVLIGASYLQAESNVPLTPPNAKPGECYAKVLLPAEYETVEDKVLVKEASEKIEIIPAVFDTVGAEVEITPPTHKLTPIPAVYKDVNETIETKPAYLVWRHAPDENATLVSPTILAAVKAAGVDVDNAKPGECYREYYTPRKFVKETEQIMVQGERNETVVVPPEFEDGQKSIVIKPAYHKIVEVPAVYEETEEKVMVSPEKTVWKKGENPAQAISGATGEIMCLVKIPAKYETIKKKVLKEPATIKSELIPEENATITVNKMVSDSKVIQQPLEPIYATVEKTKLASEAEFVWYPADAAVDNELIYSGEQVCLTEEPAEKITITKKVLVEPARVESEEMPPVVKTVQTQVLVQDANITKIPIPAEYKTVLKKKKVKDQTVAWKRILCQTNMTKDIIKRIQEALNARGYNTGTPDGLLGKGTKNALDKFQRDNGLATGGLTYETLEALGVK